ncbi:MAG: hypothetical protein ABR502_00615 [Chitinophagaceae bacterium]
MPFKSLFPVILVLFSFSAFSQTIKYDAVTGQIANLAQAQHREIISEVRFDGVDGTSGRIPYDKVKGSPFWREEFIPAKLYTKTGQIYSATIRLNLATNEIHFLKNGEEMVLVGLDVSRIMFTDKDSVIFLGNIPHLFIQNKKVDDYMQVLSAGEYQLLKHKKRKVGSADSLFRTQKRYFFTDEIYYFLHFNDRVERIKKLNKDAILEYLPLASSFAAFIEQNKIDFKKEADVIRFLNYYNANRKALQKQ